MPDITFSTSPSGTNRRQVLTAAIVAFLTSLHPMRVRAADDDGIFHSSETIHQEPVFQASRARVYRVLTVAQEFEHVVRLSAAAQSMAIGDKPTELRAEAGAPFSLFGGYITGRNIELVPNERIIQAWRAQSWSSGDYSIVKFDLKENGATTKIIFDHRGFPEGLAKHLAQGWKTNYWQPLEKYLNTQR